MMNKTVWWPMRLITYTCIILLIASCNNHKGPDVSKIRVDLQLERFERDFFSLDTTRLTEGLAALDKKYPRFFPYFINDILRLDNTQMAANSLQLNDAGIFALKFFLRSYRNINDSIQQKYKNLNSVKDELVDAFKHVKYYFPDYALPASVVTYVAPFDAESVVLTPKYMGIGLQLFAGKNFSVYQDPQLADVYPAYVTKRFDREYIAEQCVYAIISTDLYRDSSESLSLIEQMVERGKQWYLLNKFLPDAPDSIKTGFTGNQVKFINDNEGNIWSQFLKDTPDPYTVDQDRLKNYLGESPFTQDMPHDLEGNGTPGNIGQWIGWRIVEKFAAGNSKLSVQQVLATPAKKIFQEAKYKPK
jgi:hypothetical protein